MQILQSAAESSEGIAKTQLMYKAFLSYAQLKEYIPLLTVNNLLEYHPDNQTYKTTEKGMKFISAYNKMREYIKPLGD